LNGLGKSEKGSAEKTKKPAPAMAGVFSGVCLPDCLTSSPFAISAIPRRSGRPLSQVQLSLSRLNHWLPRIQAHPEVVLRTAEFHHQITDPLLPQADPVLHDAAALDATVDMLDPQPTLVNPTSALETLFWLH